jgi:hypothetical protein
MVEDEDEKKKLKTKEKLCLSYFHRSEMVAAAKENY